MAVIENCGVITTKSALERNPDIDDEAALDDALGLTEAEDTALDQSEIEA